MASARHGADAAWQCRERPCLARLGPGPGAALPGRAARYARLWAIDADAARLPWTLDRLAEDFCLLMDNLRIDRFHLVGAKIGGTIARAFAARRPARVNPYPPAAPHAAERAKATLDFIARHGN